MSATDVNLFLLEVSSLVSFKKKLNNHESNNYSVA